MDPYFDFFAKTTLVTNASNLRKLYHFFYNRHRVVERFDMEFRRKTLFISKWNGDPSLSSSMGHGAGFERKTCRYPYDDNDVMLRVSASHHRVLRYRFSGLDCVVQSEVDAYYCDCDHSPPAVSRAVATPLSRTPTSPLENDAGTWTTATRRRRRSSTASFRAPSSPPLSSPSSSSSRSPRLRHKAAPSPSTSPTSIFKFSSLPLDDPGHSPSYTSSHSHHPSAPSNSSSSSTPTLRIHHLGRDIPSPCLLEVKTASSSAPVTFAPDAQLYFSRRKKLYTARHKAGVFHPDGATLQEDKGADLEAWEGENQAVLGKMGALLRMLWWRVKDLSQEGVEGVSLVCESDGEGEGGLLSAELYTRGEGGGLVPPF